MIGGDRAEHALYLDFCGYLCRLLPGETFSFGKRGDLVLDERDDTLHRDVGSFEYRQGLWWLSNRGSRIVLAVDDRLSPSYKQIGPGLREPLVYSEFVVRLRSRVRGYEIDGSLTDRFQHREDRNGGEPGSVTGEWGKIALTNDERLIVVALARRRLEDGSNAIVELPTNEEVQQQLGVKKTTFNRRLDYLCTRLASSGVEGLVGKDGQLARDRRHVLVNHLVRYGLVTTEDLKLLEQG